MKRRFVFVIACLLCWLVGPSQAQQKTSYNIWGKENIRYLQARVNSEPFNARLRVLLAGALYEDGRTREARAQLHEALELRPDFAEAHCNLGVMLQSQGLFEKAITHYEKALDQDSTLVEALAGLGVLLCRLNRHAEGLDLLESAVALEPRRTNARYNLAVAYHEVGDFNKAIDHLTQLLAVDTGYPGAQRALARAHYSLGILRLQTKQPGPAIEALNQALAHESRTVDLYFAKGLAHLQTEEYLEAEAAFRKILTLERDHLPALHNLGVVCERLGRFEEALQFYLQVKKLAPHLATLEAVQQASFDVQVLLK